MSEYFPYPLYICSNCVHYMDMTLHYVDTSKAFQPFYYQKTSTGNAPSPVYEMVKAPFCSAPCFFFSHLIRLTLHDQNNRIHPIKTWFDDISSLQKQKSSFQVSLRLLSLSHYFSFSSIWPSRITLLPLTCISGEQLSVIVSYVWKCCRIRSRLMELEKNRSVKVLQLFIILV